MTRSIGQFARFHWGPNQFDELMRGQHELGFEIEAVPDTEYTEDADGYTLDALMAIGDISLQGWYDDTDPIVGQAKLDGTWNAYKSDAAQRQHLLVRNINQARPLAFMREVGLTANTLSGARNQMQFHDLTFRIFEDADLPSALWGMESLTRQTDAMPGGGFSRERTVYNQNGEGLSYWYEPFVIVPRPPAGTAQDRFVFVVVCTEIRGSWRVIVHHATVNSNDEVTNRADRSGNINCTGVGIFVAEMDSSVITEGHYQIEVHNYVLDGQVPHPFKGFAYIARIDDDDLELIGTLSIPGLPVLGDVTPTSDQITVEWTPPPRTGNSAITAYQVRHRQSGGAWSDWATATGGGAARSHDVTGLNASTEYEIQLRARNAIGATYDPLNLTSETNA